MLFLCMTSAFLKYCDKKNSSQVPEFRPNIPGTYDRTVYCHYCVGIYKNH